MKSEVSGRQTCNYHRWALKPINLYIHSIDLIENRTSLNNFFNVVVSDNDIIFAVNYNNQCIYSITSVNMGMTGTHAWERIWAG